MSAAFNVCIAEQLQELRVAEQRCDLKSLDLRLECFEIFAGEHNLEKLPLLILVKGIKSDNYGSNTKRLFNEVRP